MESKASKLYVNIWETRRFQSDNQLRNQNILPYTTIFFPLLKKISRDFLSLDILKYRAFLKNIIWYCDIATFLASFQIYRMIKFLAKISHAISQLLKKYRAIFRNFTRRPRISREKAEISRDISGDINLARFIFDAFMTYD